MLLIVDCTYIFSLISVNIKVYKSRKENGTGKDMSIDYDVMFDCFVKKEEDGSYSPCAILEGEINLKSGNTNKLLICENNSIYLGSTDINGNNNLYRDYLLKFCYH